MAQFDDIAKQQRSLQIEYDQKLTDIRDDIIRLMQSSIGNAEQRTAARLKEMSKLSVLQAEHTACLCQARIVRSLYRPVLRKRWREIPEANLTSNSWLFSMQSGIYPKWLEQGNGVLLITGKVIYQIILDVIRTDGEQPGSGKSTLMKYASEHPDTIQHLSRWAASSRLYLASFYFWNQGFDLQKTQIGLFQSLLYQILRSSPTLAKHITSDRLEHEEWELQHLKVAFRSLTNAALGVKYCFFIDGLDEYDGSQDEVVEMLGFLTQSSQIKICASTRFRTIIQNETKMLRHTVVISDHTKADMANHVRRTLSKEPKFRELQRAPENVPGCESIVSDIATYANGVWLWVALVTKDLVYAVKTGESVKKLQEITNEFPRSLEAYFKHMIDNIQPSYQADMAKYFLLAIHELQPLPLFAFSLLDKEQANPDYAIEAQLRPVKDRRDKNLKARVHNRCGDLMEVGNGPHPVFLSQPVDFMHRTVAEYLRDYHNDDLRSKLARTDPGFEPMVSLCRIQLFLLKSLGRLQLKNQKPLNQLMSITDELLYYAREVELRVEAGEVSPTIAILDELDRVNTHHARLSGIANHWTHLRDVPGDRGLDVYFEGGYCNFLALTVQARLTKYVRTKLARDPALMRKRGRPLLDYALRPLRKTPLGMQYHSEQDDPSFNLEMVQLLLEFDPDPATNLNRPLYSSGDRSVWTLFLVSCHEAVRYSRAASGRKGISESLRETWRKACEELLRAGAEPDNVLVRGTTDLWTYDMIQAVFNEKSEDLLAMMAERSRELKERGTSCVVM